MRELGLEAFLIDFEALLLANDLLKADRKSICVVQAKRDLARQRANTRLLDPFVIVGDQLKAPVQGSPEALFLLVRDLFDEGAALGELRIDIAHVVDDAKRAVMQEWLPDAEAVPVPNRPPHHATQNIRTPVFVGEHALGDQEGGGARVVRDDPHADVVLGLTRSVALPRNLGGQVDDRT